MSWTITPSQALPDDADAVAYIAAVEAADGEALEPAVRLAINSFVKGCKADGIWPAIKASCILAGAKTLSGALVPLAGTAPTNNNFVAGDYNRKTGLVGDGSTKYLDSNRNNNADPQNSSHLAVFASDAATSGSGEYPYYIGAGGAGTGSNNMGRFQLNGNLFARSRNGANDLFGGGGDIGLIGISRSSSSGYIARRSGQNTSITRESQSPDQLSTFVFTTNNNGPLSIGYSNSRLAFYSIGESLDLALLDARVTDLINAFAAAIP